MLEMEMRMRRIIVKVLCVEYRVRILITRYLNNDLLIDEDGWGLQG
jgi:hypothetical protein